MKRLSDRTFQWVYYLVASFYLGTIFLRSILTYQNTPELFRVLGVFLLWLVLFLSEPTITNKWSRYFLIYLTLQTGLVFLLLRMPGYADFFASLYVILSMQIMLHWSSKIWLGWISLCALVTILLLLNTYESQAYALTLIYTAANVFYGFYARATRQAQTIHEENLVLAQELQDANQKLQAYSTQMEQLTIARERNRLARDLHDSVTQTVFSMTLTIQSALLLLDRDQTKVEDQLDRLSQLAQNALSEMQMLISELKPEKAGTQGLATALRRHLKGGHFPEDLVVNLDVKGEQSLSPAEEQGLFHIVQEALNNSMKHAQTHKAQVRLHLTEPMWIEVEDQGRGFDLQQVQGGGKLGLLSMRERAAEIGWDLQIRTSPGSGTCVRVEKLLQEVTEV